MFNWLFGRDKNGLEPDERQDEIDAARREGFKRKDVQGVPFWEINTTREDKSDDNRK